MIGTHKLQSFLKQNKMLFDAKFLERNKPFFYRFVFWLQWILSFFCVQGTQKISAQTSTLITTLYYSAPGPSQNINEKLLAHENSLI